MMKKDEMKKWFLPLIVGGGAGFVVLFLGFRFYGSYGLSPGIGEFLGLFHAALGLGFFFGYMILLFTKRDEEKVK